MQNTLLQRVFTLASTASNADSRLRAAGAVLRQLTAADRNDAAAAAAIAAVLGKLDPATQEQVVAAVEALAK